MAIKISNNTIIDDNRNIVDAGIATAIFFDGYVPGDDKNYDVNTTLNNQKVNVALEGDLVIGSGVTFTVSTGTTVVLNPLDYENASASQLFVNDTINLGISSSFIIEASGIGSVGINTTQLIGVGIVTTNNIIIGQLVKPIPYIIGAGTTVIGIAGTPGRGIVNINPSTLNSSLQSEVYVDFGYYTNTTSNIIINGNDNKIITTNSDNTKKIIIDGNDGNIYNGSNKVLVPQSGGNVIQTVFSTNNVVFETNSTSFTSTSWYTPITTSHDNSAIRITYVIPITYFNSTSTADENAGAIRISSIGIGTIPTRLETHITDAGTFYSFESQDIYTATFNTSFFTGQWIFDYIFYANVRKGTELIFYPEVSSASTNTFVSVMPDGNQRNSTGTCILMEIA